MSISNRLDRTFAQASALPLNKCSKYTLVSDCHRGTGTSSDNFLKNQHLYFAATDYYYREGFTYIELGDGEELWENRCMHNITDIHSDVYKMFEKFKRQNRLYLIYGNHNIVMKKNPAYQEGIILYAKEKPECSLYLTHGHQASLLNSVFWPMARFLVRYVWGPLENMGVLDPTSAAKNYTVKENCEKGLERWAADRRHILITGHTHRPILSKNIGYYCNTGSCVHPRCITCIEIECGKMTLVKWSMNARPDSILYVEREIMSGPEVLLP